MKNFSSLPAGQYFEVLSKTYMKLIDEKYLSPDKVLQVINSLKLNNMKAKSIILTTMREATRHTSMELYGSNKKRQDILNAIMGALKKLEEQENKSKNTLKGKTPQKN